MGRGSWGSPGALSTWTLLGLPGWGRDPHLHVRKLGSKNAASSLFLGLRRPYLIIFFCQTKTTSEFAGQLPLNQPHLSDENHSSPLSVKSSGRKFSKIPSLSSLPQNRRILEWDVLGDEGLHLRRNQSSRPQPPPGTNTEAQCQAAGQVQAPDSQPRDPPHPVIGTMLPTSQEAQGGQSWGPLPSNSPPSGD